MRSLDDMKRDRGVLERTITEHTGKSMRGRECGCPFPEHPDKHPSAGIWEGGDGTWLFKCHPCNFAGSFIDVEARLTGRTTADVIRSLDIERDKRPYAPPAPAPKKSPYVYPTLAVLEKSFTDEFKAEPSGRWEYADLSGAIELIVYRFDKDGGGKTFRQVTPRDGGWVKTAEFDKTPLYNLAGILKPPAILVVEGEKAADACIAAGIPTTTSPMGAQSIARGNWELIAGKNVYLWPDNDSVGIEAMKALAKILEGHGCKVKIIDISRLNLQPKGDAYDFLKDIPEGERRKAMFSAFTGAPQSGLMQELKERAAKISNGLLRPVEWPWRRFTEMTGFSIPGTVALICGDGGSTKSFWLIEATSHWYEMGIPFAMYQLEDERAMHAYRAIAQREKRPELLDHVWGEGREEEVSRIMDKHTGFIDVLGRSLDGETKDNITYDKLLKWTEERAKGGAKIIAIDPITMAAPEKDQWAADKNFTDSLKRIARDYSANVVLVIHPKKGRKGSISLDDIAGGSAFGRFAHAVVWLDNHGDPIKSVVKDSFATMERLHNRTMHVVKARNARGQGARIAFNFNQDLTFSEHGMILSKEAQSRATITSPLEQRAIANSQQRRAPTPPVEQTYKEDDDDQDLF